MVAAPVARMGWGGAALSVETTTATTARAHRVCARACACVPVASGGCCAGGAGGSWGVCVCAPPPHTRWRGATGGGGGGDSAARTRASADPLGCLAPAWPALYERGDGGERHPRQPAARWQPASLAARGESVVAGVVVGGMMGALPSRGDGGGLPSLMEGACGPSRRPPPPPLPLHQAAASCVPLRSRLAPFCADGGGVGGHGHGHRHSSFPSTPRLKPVASPPLYILHLTLEGLFSSFLFSSCPLGHLLYSAAPGLGPASTRVASTREDVPRPRV